MRNFLLGILVMLLIGGVALTAYFYGKKKAKPEITPTAALSTVLTPTPSPFLSPTVMSSVKTNENELIKQAILKEHNWTENQVTINVSNNDGKYASGTISAQGGGGYFYAVKDNGVWVIVAEGNGVIMCSNLSKYPDYPTTLIPECYDQTTGKTVKR